MNAATVNFLKKVADNSGIKASIYDDYSGRGMYGKTTQGIVTDSVIELLGASVMYVLEGDIDEKEKEFIDLKHLHTDSMGRDEILY